MIVRDRGFDNLRIFDRAIPLFPITDRGAYYKSYVRSSLKDSFDEDEQPRTTANKVRKIDDVDDDGNHRLRRRRVHSRTSNERIR